MALSEYAALYFGKLVALIGVPFCAAKNRTAVWPAIIARLHNNLAVKELGFRIINHRLNVHDSRTLVKGIKYIIPQI